MAKVFVLADNPEDFQRIASVIDSGESQGRSNEARWITSLSETEGQIETNEQAVIIGDAANLRRRGNDFIFVESDEAYLESLGKRVKGGSEAVGLVREMIGCYYMNNYSVSRYAAFVHLSDTYLCRAFRKNIGMSVGDYIFRVRMEKAAELLRTTDLIVKTIGDTVGYTNFSYFCKRFRIYFGISPTQYREAFRRRMLHTEAKDGSGK